MAQHVHSPSYVSLRYVALSLSVERPETFPETSHIVGTIFETRNQQYIFISRMDESFRRHHQISTT